ncbi:MAG: DUF5050 domain-containing protein [Candidatus Saccharicenans sp.]|nr:DUF5050 domain-containing protein [Candidatus Saccharicenans sp.]
MRKFTGGLVFILLMAVLAGLAQVIVPQQKKADQIKKLEVVEPTSIRLNRSEAYVFLYHPNMLTTTKEGYQLKASIYPENATSKAVQWESSDPAVVTVDGNGNLVPMKPGQAVITAIAKANGIRAQCRVYVVTKKEAFGNTFSNLANEGYLAVQNDWLYYANPSNNMVLFKMKLDGSGKQRLGTVPCSFINVIGNKIFYLGNWKVNQVDIYGEGSEVLTPNVPAQDVLATWDKVYFLSPNPAGLYTIYRSNFDGTDRNIIDGSWTSYIDSFFGNGAWFVISSNMKNLIHLKRIQSNGQWSGSYNLFAGQVKNYVVQTLSLSGGASDSYMPDHIYLIDSKEDSIRKIGPLYDLTKKKDEVLFKHLSPTQKLTGLSLIDDWLFYCTETMLSKMKTDGSQNQVVITNLPAGEHYLFPIRTGSGPDDLWIFVYTRDAQNKFSLLKVRHDGLDRISIN